MISAYLFDANGDDREVELPAGDLPSIPESQLLWVDVIGREEADISSLAVASQLEEKAVSGLKKADSRPAVHNYGTFFYLRAFALPDIAEPDRGNGINNAGRVTLDFLVGSNWLITVADVTLEFLSEFRSQDRGETLIGKLSSSTLAAALLHGLLTTYLERVEALEAHLDKIDVRLLAKRSSDERLLQRIIEGRRFISAVRRSLVPQRAVFSGLARPDFALIAESEAAPHFAALERRFDRVVDTVEHGRELVQGSFDLFTTRIAENTNTLIRRLTFFGITLGAIGAVAGIFGMNFETPYTASGVAGFWLVIGSLLFVSIFGAIVARLRQWI